MSIDKAKVSKSQYLFAAIALVALILLGISSIFESQSAGDRTRLLSNVETPAASIIFTQRETLVYSTQLALWSNGGTTRRNVQIARALLAQRLAVVDSSGRNMGSRANAAYWRALKKADAIVAAAPIGILPERLHPSINEVLLPVIDAIVEEARNLVISYQRSVDQEMKKLADETARRDALNLGFLYIFILAGGLFLFLNTRANFKKYRLIREQIDAEQKELEEARKQVVQLQDLDAAKNALISNVNHELRTPLTSIIGYIELLQRENPESQSAEHRLHLEVLQRNSLILLNLVESLLSLSKFDSGVGKLPNEPVSLREAADSAIFTLRPALEKAGVTASLTGDGEIFVRGDHAQINQVLINLIANSIKFSPTGSEVNVAISQKNESARIQISDKGVGIPDADIPHIFERFYQGANVTDSHHQGTGLGLAIVDQVIKHHHGEITLNSEVRKGSTFTITLPLYSARNFDE